MIPQYPPIVSTDQAPQTEARWNKNMEKRA